MLESLGLTISGLIFLLVVAVISFTKKRYNSLETLIYRSMLFITIFLLILEIICVFSMASRELYPMLNEILCRTYILGDVIWFITLIGYTKSLGNTKHYEKSIDFFKEKFMLVLMIIGLIGFIVSCMLPLTFTSSDNSIYVIGGPGVFALYFVFAFFGAYMCYLLIDNKNNNSLVKRMPTMFFLIAYFISGIIQIFSKTDLNDLTYIFAIYVIMMYFSSESEDLKMVSELKEAKQAAEIADKEKTLFLSTMSHQIRTPMNTIMGFSETLIKKKKLTEEEVRSDVKNINISANNLLNIINNILDISRLDSKREEIIKVEYSLGDVLNDLSEVFKDKYDKNDIDFSIQLDNDFPSLIEGDRKKVYKILNNILSNAFKYTKSGKVSLNTTYSVKGSNVNITFTISDTGIGIKKEDYSKLFQNFSKLSSSDDYLSDGTGLGLVITKKLVDLLGGTIDFESEYEIGTTFTITLKQKIINDQPIGDFKNKKNKNGTVNCSKYNALIVDDNNLNRKIIIKLLDKYKFKIEEAASGNECIELVKKGKYDIIFLDHLMPELDGIETIKLLKKLNIDSKIIAMTANEDTASEKEYIKAGFDSYLSKPIDVNVLNDIINEYFKK